MTPLNAPRHVLSSPESRPWRGCPGTQFLFKTYTWTHFGFSKANIEAKGGYDLTGSHRLLTGSRSMLEWSAPWHLGSLQGQVHLAAATGIGEKEKSSSDFPPAPRQACSPGWLSFMGGLGDRLQSYWLSWSAIEHLTVGRTMSKWLQRALWPLARK